MSIMIVEGMRIPRGELVQTPWIWKSRMVLKLGDRGCLPFLRVSVHILL